MAPQGLEKIDSAPGNAMAPEAIDPQYLAPRAATAPAPSALCLARNAARRLDRQIPCQMPVEQIVAPALHPLRHQGLRLVKQERDDGLLAQQQPLGVGQRLGAGA